MYVETQVGAGPFVLVLVGVVDVRVELPGGIQIGVFTQISWQFKNEFAARIEPDGRPNRASIFAQVSSAWDMYVRTHVGASVVDVRVVVEPPTGMQMGVYTQISWQFKNEFTANIEPDGRPN